MPKIVDHDSRREEIVEAVWRLISRDGIASATTRNIAREAGCSNGILSHYFSDKSELLHAALERGYRRVEKQVLECRARLRGFEALREVLKLAVALTEDKVVGNKVELAYLGEAVGNPRLTKQHYGTYETYRGIVRELLVEARRAGEIARDVEIDTVADALVALVDGLGMEAALFPEAFPASRQAKVVDGVLATLAGRRGSRRAPVSRRSAVRGSKAGSRSARA